MRRALALLAICGGLAALFATAARTPAQPSSKHAGFAESFSIVKLQPVGAAEVQVHDSTSVNVWNRGGSCSFSVLPGSVFSFQCEPRGGGEPPLAETIARARPILKDYGLCITAPRGRAIAPRVRACSS